MDESLVVRRETQIAAPPATVFAFLTDPQKILSWMGAEADTDAHPGGLYLVKDVAGRPGRTARGQFREVVPVHRLAYSFGWEDDENVPPGSSLVEIDLIDRDGGTLVRMTHTGLPNAYECDGHAKGWAYYLADWAWPRPAGTRDRPRSGRPRLTALRPHPAEMPARERWRSQARRAQHTPIRESSAPLGAKANRSATPIARLREPHNTLTSGEDSPTPGGDANGFGTSCR